MGAPLRGAELRRTAVRPAAWRAVAGRLPVLAFLAAPVGAGLLFTLLPAFGFLPALGGRTLSLEPWRALLAEPGLERSAGLSFATGLAATALSVGLTASFLAAGFGTGLFARLQGLIAPALAAPHAAAALGLAFLIAPSGFIARLLSPELTGWRAPPDLLILNDAWGLSLVAGLALKEAPFLLLVSIAALPQARAADHARLAASLGYGRVAGFLLAVWPLVYRQIRLPVLAVLAFSTSVVDVALILGPDLPATLSVRVAQWTLDPDLSRRFMAAAGAVLQLGVSAAAILAWLALERAAGPLATGLAEGGRRFARDAALRGLAIGAALLSFAALFAGLALLLVWSAAGLWPFPDAWPEAVSLDVWRRAWPRAGGLVGQTAALGLGVAAAALILTVASLALGGTRRRTDAALIYLPLLAPQASFLFGLQLAGFALGLEPGVAAVALAHLVFALPYALIALAPPWAALDPRFERVAASLGASPASTFLRIRLALLAPALGSAFAIAFAVSAGLYLPTLLIGAGRVETLTTEAVALASGGDRRLIGVYAALQAALPALGFALALLAPRLIHGGRQAAR